MVLCSTTVALNGTLALNSSLADYVKTVNWNATNTSYTTWANVNNGTMLNYSSALNGTLALNSSLADYVKTVNWNATNTSYTTWANVNNGTTAVINAANTFGAFNQTFNTSNIVLWALLNRTGIQRTTPQNTLNVIGDLNATTSVFA